MPKITKVLSGTSSGSVNNFSDAVYATVYTVPTGKVSRIEILHGRGIITSDGSIHLWQDRSGGSQPVLIGPRISDSGAYLPNNYTRGTRTDETSSFIVRYVTYLKAGATVQVPGGNYSILIVEEDAG